MDTEDTKTDAKERKQTSIGTSTEKMMILVSRSTLDVALSLSTSVGPNHLSTSSWVRCREARGGTVAFSSRTCKVLKGLASGLHLASSAGVVQYVQYLYAGIQRKKEKLDKCGQLG